MGESLLKGCLLEHSLLSGNSTRPARELSPDSSAAVQFGGGSSGSELMFIGGDSSRMGERSRELCLVQRSILSGDRTSVAAVCQRINHVNQINQLIN
jgi:hypothetical protein